MAEKIRMRFTVNAPGILLEAERNFRGGADSDSPGLVMGLQMIRAGLHRIAQRVVELEDPVLLQELEDLGIVHREPQESDDA